MSANPNAVRLRGLLDLVEETLRERLKPGERIVYTGRLAPLPPPPRHEGIEGDLASALHEIPDRKSRLTREAGR